MLRTSERFTRRPMSTVARSLRCVGRAPSRSRSTAVRPPIGGRAHQREDPWWCHHARAPTTFCSAGIHAWPLDANGRLTFNGPSRGPGGTQLSWPRLTTRPFLFSGRIEAWCAERVVRERADGPFSFSGRIRVINSNIS
jgi:hypothetical protein